MSNVTVNIVIQGLIALSPHYVGDDMASRMTALAVDSRLAPSGSVCVIDHMPMIEIPTSSPNCPEFSSTGARTGCKFIDEACICHLDRHEITLLPETNPDPPPIKLSRVRPADPLPADNDNDTAGDFSWVAHLSNLQTTLDPRYRKNDEVPPTPLAARFTFPFDSLLACDHSVRRDNLGENVHSFQFHKLLELAKPEHLHQAIAEVLVATVNLDIAEGESPILHLQEFGGGASRSFPLAITEGSATIKMMNHRDKELPLGDPCDDGIGRDFALFYELVVNPPVWQNRLLPHVKLTSGRNKTSVIPTDCEKFKMPMSRPVCPLATF